METALTLTGMEYGGITPIGLPGDWVILVDEAVMAHDFVVIGAGVRGSKLAVNTKVFDLMSNVEVNNIKKTV